MPGDLQAVRKRIKSIKNTRQITKAMEAVSASKMRKSVEKATKSKHYAMFAAKLIQDIAEQGVAKTHPFVQKHQGTKILLLLITSNRGLCGGFNSQIMKKVIEYTNSIGKENVDVICLGKKGQIFLKRFGKNFIAAFDNFDYPTSVDTQVISEFIIKQYLEKQYAKAMIAFTDFKSAIRQQPVIKQVLPLSYEILDVAGPEQKTKNPTSVHESEKDDYIFEPDPKQILEIVIPRMLKTQVFQTILESSASEHSARMLAMRNATDNANDIINELTLSYNQARQASITQEIAEISASKAALGE